MRPVKLASAESAWRRPRSNSDSVFATDAPFDAEDGRLLLRTTISAIKALDIPQADKNAILGGNARRLLKLN